MVDEDKTDESFGIEVILPDDGKKGPPCPHGKEVFSPLLGVLFFMWPIQYVPMWWNVLRLLVFFFYQVPPCSSRKWVVGTRQADGSMPARLAEIGKNATSSNGKMIRWVPARTRIKSSPSFDTIALRRRHCYGWRWYLNWLPSGYRGQMLGKRGRESVQSPPFQPAAVPCQVRNNPYP